MPGSGPRSTAALAALVAPEAAIQTKPMDRPAPAEPQPVAPTAVDVGERDHDELVATKPSASPG